MHLYHRTAFRALSTLCLHPLVWVCLFCESVNVAMFTLFGSLLNTRRIDRKMQHVHIFDVQSWLWKQQLRKKKDLRVNLEVFLEFLTYLTIFKIGYMFKHYNTFLKGWGSWKVFDDERREPHQPLFKEIRQQLLNALKIKGVKSLTFQLH